GDESHPAFARRLLLDDSDLHQLGPYRRLGWSTPVRWLTWHSTPHPTEDGGRVMRKGRRSAGRLLYSGRAARVHREQRNRTGDRGDDRTAEHADLRVRGELTALGNG